MIGQAILSAVYVSGISLEQTSSSRWNLFICDVLWCMA